MPTCATATDNAMDDDKLITLESRIAWQDAAIQDLSDVVARQQRELEQLRAWFVGLQARLAEAADADRPIPGHEPPPHY